MNLQWAAFSMVKEAVVKLGTLPSLVLDLIFKLELRGKYIQAIASNKPSVSETLS